MKKNQRICENCNYLTGDYDDTPPYSFMCWCSLSPGKDIKNIQRCEDFELYEDKKGECRA